MVLKNYSEYLNLKHGKIEEFEILIHYLVPINALSSVIGKEGTRIKKVKKESEVKIYADKVNEYFKYMRSIKMQSMSDEKILKAVNMIQEFVREEIDFEQKSIKNKKENYRTIQSNFRIMLTRDEAKYIIKNLDLPKLCEKRKLMIDIKEEPDNAIIEKGNYIATIKGRSKDIDHGICNFCEILEEFFQKTSKEIKLSILVSKNNTGVIIGPEGSTIRTIATQSGGAKINVEPLKLMKPVSEGNKAEERIIIIRGRLIAREIAASLIKDKIEQTKLENVL